MKRALREKELDESLTSSLGANFAEIDCPPPRGARPTLQVERRRPAALTRRQALSVQLNRRCAVIVAMFVGMSGCVPSSPVVPAPSRQASADDAHQVRSAHLPASDGQSDSAPKIGHDRAAPVDLQGRPVELVFSASPEHSTENPSGASGDSAADRAGRGGASRGGASRRGASRGGASVSTSGELTPAPWTVLVFVQGDCPIANQYVPELAELRREFLAEGVRWIHVYPDPDETAAVVAQHVAEYQVAADVVLDPHHVWVDRYRVRVTPEVVVLDQQGQVCYQGRIDDRFRDYGQGRRSARRRDLREALTSLVGGQPIAVTQTEAVGCLIIDLK